ncbi:hypothetical protein GH714_015387 [Hevea brasiliensis]|uniref:Uncharacterized protein n=1 Tax=Hevea brasiliensis TaxID=3981 RepID=A0A6A6KRU9_HEVBR|nr:hypothetical protein GH714_015387 [Hevea brasiliensis]
MSPAGFFHDTILVDLYVLAVAWNHHEPQVLGGSFNLSVFMSQLAFRAWHGIPTLTLICVNLEDGTVQGFDIWAVKSDSPSDSKPSSTLHAHDKAVCRVSYNPSVPNVGISVFNAISN